MVHEAIEGEVNDKYIERQFVPRKKCVRNAQAPRAQQPYNERAYCAYIWDMLEANHKVLLFMHDSMHQLQLQIREPHVDHCLDTRKEFLDHANWPEGRPFQPEGAVGV